MSTLDSLEDRQVSHLDVNEMDEQQVGRLETVDVMEYLSICYQRRWLVLKVTVLVLALGMVITFLQRPQYRATAKLLVTSANANLNADAIPLITALQTVTQRRSIGTQVEIMTSEDLLNDAFHRLPLSMRKQGFGVSDVPTWAIRVGNVKDADIIEITARAHTPTAASTLANTVADLYCQRDLDQNRQAISKVRKDVENNMREIKGQLDTADAYLSEYKRQTGLLDPNTQFAKLAEYQANLQVEIGNARAVVAAMKNAQGVLQQQLADEKQTVVNSTLVTENPQFNAITTRIDNLNAERAALLQEYQPNSPEVQALSARITQEEARLRQTAATITSSVQHSRNPIRDEMLKSYASNLSESAAQEARIKAMSVELEQSKAQAQALPAQERRLTEMTRQVAFLQGTYDMLGQKYYALLASEKTTLPSAKLISRANPPEEQSSPNPLQNAGLFALLGLVLGSVISLRSGHTTVTPMTVRTREEEPALPHNHRPEPPAIEAREEVADNAVEQLSPPSLPAPEESPEKPSAPRAASSRWTSAKKREVVLEVLRGTPIEEVAQAHHLALVRLALWHDRVREGIEQACAEGSADDPAAAGALDPEQTLQMAVRLLGDEPIATLAEEYHISLLTLALWKDRVNAGVDRALKGQRNPDLLAAEYEETRRRLHTMALENAELRASVPPPTSRQQKRAKPKSA